MPAMMKSMGQSSLETLTDACENPATGEKQHGNQDISKVYHGNVTSTPRISRGAHPFGEPAQSFCAEVGHQRFFPPTTIRECGLRRISTVRLLSRHR
jgi:hypothetical protein